jgi:gametolysin
MIEKALAWFYARKGRVSYSMENRNGPDSYDCSSSVYHALKEAGLLPASYWIGNTDTLFDALEKNGWVRLPGDANGEADTQRGDIFIWGIRGNSGGALGHTGMFVDTDNVINCRYQAGIVIDNHDWLWSASGYPPYAFYRYVGKPKEAKRVALPEVYYADEVATVFDLRQIRCNRLIDEFDWGDNGVPVSVAVRTDKDGYLLDGEINTGDYFRIVGGTEVLDETTENNKRYLQLKMADDGIWVLAERVRELANGDAGTPRPEKRPVVVTPLVKSETDKKLEIVAPQPTNEDVMRSIAKLSQDVAKNKSLLEKIIDFLMSIFKFKK